MDLTISIPHFKMNSLNTSIKRLNVSYGIKKQRPQHATYKNTPKI